MTTLAEAVGGRGHILGGPFGSKLTQADYSAVGVPVIRGNNMEQDGRWLGGEFVFVSEAKVEADLSSNLARPGDIIVTQRGTLGQISIVPDHLGYERYVISQSQMAVSVDTAFADRDFVFYYLRSRSFLDHITSQTIQTGVPHINLSILRDTIVDWPSLVEQQAIGQVLSALDDKIELNRRMTVNLETLILRIFKGWFIDFDPVRAKIQGRVSGLPADLSDAFPEQFNEWEVPDGWRRETLGDLCTLKRGYDLPTLQRTPGKVPIVSSSGISGNHSEALVKAPGVVTGRYGSIGEVFFIDVDFWPLNTSLYVSDFRDNEPKPPG